MTHVIRYTEEFYAKALAHAGTPLGGKILALVRRIETDPRGSSREGRLAPCVRHAPVSQGAYYVNWVICEECFKRSVEERAAACGLCADAQEVIILNLYLVF